MADKKTKDAPVASGKAQALQLAVDQIEKQFGKGSIMRLGEAHKIDVETIPTGSLSLDLALGGGIPKGRIIEIYGPESSGKTTVCLHAVAEVQKAGGTAAYVDAEHALDPAYAKRLGVNTDTLLISQPDSGEQALEVVETLVRSNAVDIIVVDSVAAPSRNRRRHGRRPHGLAGPADEPSPAKAHGRHQPLQNNCNFC
jgi:recombination protein RecA